MIKLDKKYWLKVDRISYTIGEMRKDKEGNDVFAGEWHYGNINAVIWGYKNIKVRQGVSEGHIKTLEDLQKTLLAIDKHIDKVGEKILNYLKENSREEV